MPKLKSASTIGGERGGKLELHWLAIAGDHEKISDLLQQHSRPKRRTSIFTISRTETVLDVNAQDELGRSALHWAAARGEVECAKQLAHHPSTKPILQDEDGMTPLHEAVIRRHKDVVEVLLQSGEICDGADIKDNGGRTVLHWAAEYGNGEVVQMLVKKEPVKKTANLPDNEHDSALHRAARNGYKMIVEELVFCGADVSAKNTKGYTALRLAVEKGHREAAMFLLQNKEFKVEDGEMAEILADKCPGAGEELLFWAAKKGHDAVVRQLLTTGKADADTADNGGRTPLWWAAGGGHDAVVKLLVENGAKADTANGRGRTPLSLAAAEGQETVVKLLLENGAKADTADNEGQTPLSWAAEGGQETVVQLLLENGAKADTADNEGRTPLSWAAMRGRETVVKLLENGAQPLSAILP